MFGCPKAIRAYRRVVYDMSVIGCRFRERPGEGDV